MVILNYPAPESLPKKNRFGVASLVIGAATWAVIVGVNVHGYFNPDLDALSRVVILEAFFVIGVFGPLVGMVVGAIGLNRRRGARRAAVLRIIANASVWLTPIILNSVYGFIRPLGK